MTGNKCLVGGGVIARELLQEVTLVCKSPRLRSVSQPEKIKEKLVNAGKMTSWRPPSLRHPLKPQRLDFGLKCGKENEEDEQQKLYRHTTMIQFSP